MKIHVIVVPDWGGSRLKGMNGFTHREDADRRIRLDRSCGVNLTRILEIKIDDPVVIDGMKEFEEQQ